jgi:hypothetical protein
MSSEPPVYKYHSVGNAVVEDKLPKKERRRGKERRRETREIPSPSAEVVNRIFTVLTWVVLFVVLLVWAFVGAIFWIPLILRAMLRFSISLIEAMFEGHKPSTAAKILRDAVSFYRRGFVVAVEVVTREQVREDEEGPVAQHRLLWEVLWALLIWYFIFLVFGWIQASPLDLVDWFFSIPWADHLRDLVGRFTG